MLGQTQSDATDVNREPSLRQHKRKRCKTLEQPGAKRVQLRSSSGQMIELITQATPGKNEIASIAELVKTGWNISVKQETEIKLEKSTNHLREEIETLEQQWHRIDAADTHAVTAYFNQFRYGLQPMKTISQPQFVRATMAPDVVFNTEYGPQAIMRSWCYMQWFDNVHVELQSLQHEAKSTNLATTKTSVTISKRTLTNVFPHLLSCQTHGRNHDGLAEKTQRVVMCGTTHFEWDSAKASDIVWELMSLVSMLGHENPLLAALRAPKVALGSEVFGALEQGEEEEDIVIVEKEELLDTAEEMDAVILHVFSFLVTAGDLNNISRVSRKWKNLTDQQVLYHSLPSLTAEGLVNWVNFKNLGLKHNGTEGECFKCFQRSTGKTLAMKKARVFPKGIKHDHIASLELISLAKDELHVFFPYVDKTLYDIMYPTGEPNGGRVLPEAVVVTLWYRAPELLMGLREYSSAVDMWSIGCIFVEMAQGSPLFTGIAEIDQLFQIFSKLSTPTSETWPNFPSLPNYHFEFPHWERRPLTYLLPGIWERGLDLLTKLLVYNPDQRITAEDALQHPYFLDEAPSLLPYTVTTLMNQVWSMMRQEWCTPAPEHIELFHVYLRQTERESWKEIKYLR
ncbi:unnamed protein product [Phytophthora lilii]|uniref:Cyclin-dependent kinase 2 homolog n=1 Tax=Phytophthora lilii TaxID=2077276 RepID=A0A9W6WTE1_9STRA|nr:unnamed protein product [Phytophthora lilii]